MILQGTIQKGISGFYYVETEQGLIECKAKGKFRYENMKPVAGDNVIVCVGENSQNTIEEILPRKNCLFRPPVANIDKLFIVVSTCEPNPNFFIIDTLTVLAEKNHIEPVIIITKADLSSPQALLDVYQKTPYTVLLNTQLDEIKALISSSVCAFTGNSGVGKSTLLNSLCPSLCLETNEISKKLGRGKHTTRTASAFAVADGTCIDTAGFSSLTPEKFEKGELIHYFPDLACHAGECKFADCTHTKDLGCKIAELAECGVIAGSRHQSYQFIISNVQ